MMIRIESKPVKGTIKLCFPSGHSQLLELRGEPIAAVVPYRGMYEDEDFIPITLYLPSGETVEHLICVKLEQGDRNLESFVERVGEITELLMVEDFEKLEELLEEDEAVFLC